MTISRRVALVFMVVCRMSCANQCKDKKCSEEGEEVIVLIQNQILVQRRDATNTTQQAKVATIGVLDAKSNGPQAHQEVRPVAVQLDGKDVRAVADGIPDWLKKVTSKVSSFMPDADGLKKSYATVKTQAIHFGKEVDECVEKLKASSAFGKTNLKAMGTAVKEGFSCLQKTANSLLDVLVNASQKTTDVLKPLYSSSNKADALIKPIVEASQRSVVAAAVALKTSSEESMDKFASKIPNATVLCQMVTNRLEAIDDKVVNFVSSLDFPKGAKLDDKSIETIQSFVNSLPDNIKDSIDEITDKVQEAADAVLQNIPGAIAKFQDGLVSTLKGQVCDAKDLPAGASSLNMGLPLLLLVGMLFTVTS